MSDRFGYVLKRPGSDSFSVRFSWGGREIWRRGGTTRAAASAKLSKAHALLVNGHKLDDVLRQIFSDRRNGKSFREVALDYLAAVEAEGSKRPTTLRFDKARMVRICTADWTARDLDEIRVADLHRWRDALRAKGQSAATVNRAASLASVVFSWAVGRSLADENPFRRMKPLNEAKDRKETYAPTPEEIAALVAAAPDRLRVYLLAASDLGARPAELRRARWENVDLEGRTFTIPPEDAKTGRVRVLPLTARLAEALACMKARANVLPISGESPRVFERVNEKALYLDFAKSKKAAAEALPSGRWEAITPRCLRTAFASDHARLGTPLPVLAAMTGHGSYRVLERHYVKLAAQSAGADAAARFEALRNTEKTSEKQAGS